MHGIYAKMAKVQEGHPALMRFRASGRLNVVPDEKRRAERAVNRLRLKMIPEGWK